MKILLFVVFIFLFVKGNFCSGQDSIGRMVGQDISVEDIPKDLKLTDAVIDGLRKMFNDTIGKQKSFDTQYKIVLIATKVTNESPKKYQFFDDIIQWEVKRSQEGTKKIIAVSPDARVLAINTLAESKDITYQTTFLSVIERDDNVDTRIAAARVLPRYARTDLIINKLIELLKTKYGANREKFNEADQTRYDDDRVAEAIIDTLGEYGDSRAFSALFQIAMNPQAHREATVKAAWTAIGKLK